MLLQEIFDALSQGELEQTNLGTITQDKWPRVVMHINLGLADLFKRFFLREGRLTIQLINGQTTYPIDPKYAVATRDSRIPINKRFILDSPSSPFKSDFLKIERVLAIDKFEVDLDNSSNKYAIITTDTKPITLEVPADMVNQALDLPEKLRTRLLQVIYRARHPKIDLLDDNFEIEEYEVMLPDTHFQALLYYISSRVLGPAGMGQQEGVSSAGYWKRYEAECAQLMMTGMGLSHQAGFDKLSTRGFA